jgi:hypothetical protein
MRTGTFIRLLGVLCNLRKMVRPCALGPLSVSSRRRMKEFALQRRPGAGPPFSSRPQATPNLAPSRGMKERRHQRGAHASNASRHPSEADPRRRKHRGSRGTAAARRRRGRGIAAASPWSSARRRLHRWRGAPRDTRRGEEKRAELPSPRRGGLARGGCLRVPSRGEKHRRRLPFPAAAEATSSRPRHRSSIRATPSPLLAPLAPRRRAVRRCDAGSIRAGGQGRAVRGGGHSQTPAHRGAPSATHPPLRPCFACHRHGLWSARRRCSPAVPRLFRWQRENKEEREIGWGSRRASVRRERFAARRRGGGHTWLVQTHIITWFVDHSHPYWHVIMRLVMS